MERAELDRRYMGRAIELARHGVLDTSPNPMVGCVITDPAGERILGEGWHRRCGEGHAEVNAVASVKNPDELRGATAYVTLEPCSHYGKTPPCALLLIAKGIGRVVIGSGDPNLKVNGRGAAMLREAGIEVTEGVLEEECLAINPKFMRAFSGDRPYITLKWACSADGFMDCERQAGEPPFKFSTALTTALAHRLRATHDAIMVGRGTMEADRPSLTLRHWPGHTPRPLVADSREPLPEMLRRLRAEGVTSLLVEGGPTLLASFISAGLYDDIRVETSPVVLGERGRAKAPQPPTAPKGMRQVGANIITNY